MLQGAQGKIQGRSHGQEHDQLPCGDTDGIEPKGTSLNVNRQLEAHQKAVGQSGHDKGQQGQAADADLAEIVHSHGRQNRGGGADEPVQRQGGGADQVEQQTAKAQTGNGRRAEQCQHAKGFGHTALNGHRGTVGENQVLQQADHHIGGGDHGALGQGSGTFFHIHFSIVLFFDRMVSNCRARILPKKNPSVKLVFPLQTANSVVK